MCSGGNPGPVVVTGNPARRLVEAYSEFKPPGPSPVLIEARRGHLRAADAAQGLPLCTRIRPPPNGEAYMLAYGPLESATLKFGCRLLNPGGPNVAYD